MTAKCVALDDLGDRRTCTGFSREGKKRKKKKKTMKGWRRTNELGILFFLMCLLDRGFGLLYSIWVGSVRSLFRVFGSSQERVVLVLLAPEYVATMSMEDLKSVVKLEDRLKELASFQE